MNKAGGFITLHRKLLDWEWHDNPNTLSVFIHILLGANHEDSRFQGMEIKRGQLVTSISSLSTSTGMSFQQARTAIDHLISTGEITSKAYSKFRVITVVKYDEYQKPTSKLTSKQQASNKQVNKQITSESAANQQQYNNINNINNETNKKREVFTPPTLDEIKQFIQETNSPVDPEKFYYNYETSGWVLSNGRKMKNWQAAIKKWESNEGRFDNGPRNGRGSGSPEGNHGQNKPDYSKFSAGIIQL